MNNNYFLLRHSQTIYQTEKADFIYPWPEQDPIYLTERGREIAKESAEKLEKEGISLIFSSDVTRARETAEIVSKELGIKIEFDLRLREVNFGTYSGGLIEDFYKDIHNPKERFFKKPENGENRKEVKERLESFIKDIEEKYRDKNILMITHGDPVMLLEGILKGLKTDVEFIDFMEKVKMPEPGEIRKIKL